MARAPRIEPAITTEYQEHMAVAAKLALRRLRRPDALDVSEALGEAFLKEKDDERRRLITATRLHLLNEQLLKLDDDETPAKEKPVKKSKPKPPPPPPEPEPEPTPPPAPKKPVKEATLNTLDLDNAAAMLMAGFGDDDEPEPQAAPAKGSIDDDMAALLGMSSDTDQDTPTTDAAAELNDPSPKQEVSDPFAELASLGAEDATDTKHDPFAEHADLDGPKAESVPDFDPFAAFDEDSEDILVTKVASDQSESDETTTVQSDNDYDPFADAPDETPKDDMAALLASSEEADKASDDTEPEEDPFAALAALGDQEDANPTEDPFAALADLDTEASSDVDPFSMLAQLGTDDDTDSKNET